ncbi:MAG: hypothetical protein ACLR8Y_16315 [Alistipes indistinctus]
MSLNPDEAIKSYVEYENKYPADKGFEVVLVGTSSVANVRETHSHYFGLAQQSNILETLNESIVGFSNQMDIDVGARQISYKQWNAVAIRVVKVSRLILLKTTIAKIY